MTFVNSKYKALNQQIYKCGNYSIVPLRYSDRLSIMKWRNEQIYHLRQSEKLTEENQTKYFNDVVANLFDLKHPNQLLFSYLENNICIGYGGLVHINWIDKNAEISFVMNTELEKTHFNFHWKKYLSLIEEVAFSSLQFHKIYTYAYNLRPHLFEAIEEYGFRKEATLKEHCFFNNEYIDVIIHEKRNNKL